MMRREGFELTVGQPRYNQSGSLFEGIAIWAERVRDLTVDDVWAVAVEGTGAALSDEAREKMGAARWDALRPGERLSGEVNYGEYA